MAVDWRKEKDFAADLKATAETITEDLAALDPPLAMERLVRFLGSHARGFERVDDSNGRLQDVYWQAAALPGNERLELTPAHSRERRGWAAFNLGNLCGDVRQTRRYARTDLRAPPFSTDMSDWRRICGPS